MKITSCNDQAECLLAVDTLNLAAVLKPIPPRKTCDGLMPINSDTWIAFTNDEGKITLHLLEDATRDEAWRFFEELSGERKHVNARLHICEPPKQIVPVNN